MKYTVDIFIPTSGNVPALRECLRSLKGLSYKKFKVLIVGYRNHKEVEKLLSTFSTLRILYIKQKRPGLVGASNDALQKASSLIFIRIDDDVVVSKKWLSAIIKTLQSDKKIGMVTGPTVITSQGITARDSLNFIVRPASVFHKLIVKYIYEDQVKLPGKILKSGAFTWGGVLKKPGKGKLQEVENVEACNFAIRKSLLNKIAGFDPIFTKGLGDYHEADIACKVSRLGYKIIFNPLASLTHKVENSINTSRAESLYRIYNFIVFYRRHITFKDIDHVLRFSTFLLLQNGYYVYKFLTTGHVSHLGALIGTIKGLTTRAL